MTEKRFECMGNGYFVDNLEDADLDNKEVVDILNALHEENEQLKKDREKLFIRERDTKNEWRELKQENERLKQRLKELEE